MAHPTNSTAASAAATAADATAAAADHAKAPAHATAKDVEGQFEESIGDLTGDTGHQIKGKAKQVQASAMNTAENLKEGAQSVAKKISEAAAAVAGDRG